MERAWPEQIHEKLRAAQVRHVTYVPDSGHARLIELCHANAGITTTALTTEEEGIGVLAGIARASGFVAAVTVSADSELSGAVDLLRTGAAPVLVVLKVAADRDPLVLPPRDGTYLKHRFREALLGSAAVA